jgi:hypothetical protein
MKKTISTAEASSSTLVSSKLDTGTMVILPLADTSTSTVMVGSMWGSFIRRMARMVGEALVIRLMALLSSFIAE